MIKRNKNSYEKEDHMKNLLLSTLIITFFISTNIFSQEVQDVVVHLKNGSVIRGNILEHIPNVSIKIKTKDGNIFVFKMEDIVKMTKDKTIEKKRVKAFSGKIPLTAFALSTIFPGGGQFYNGETGEGIIYLGLTAGGILLGGEFLSGHGESAEGMSFILFAVGGICYVWQLIDAPISSARINRKMQSQYGHQFEFDYNYNTYGIDLVVNQTDVRSSITIHF